MLIVLLSTHFVHAQCIRSLSQSAYSNTDHTITIINPIGANDTPIYLSLGTYNLKLNYNNNLLDPIEQTSTAAMVTISNSSQIVVTDNSIEFPTADYDFTVTSGSAILSLPDGTATYTWRWDHDQVIDWKCVTVPVTLISFTSQLYTSTSVKLQWTTADELNLSRYAVERSNNGYCF